jgi:hypothetical protein
MVELYYKPRYPGSYPNTVLPFFIKKTTASVRERAPAFLKIFRTWNFTTSSLLPKRSAICAFVKPSLSSSKITFSCAVNIAGLHPTYCSIDSLSVAPVENSEPHSHMVHPRIDVRILRLHPTRYFVIHKGPVLRDERSRLRANTPAAFPLFLSFEHFPESSAVITGNVFECEHRLRVMEKQVCAEARNYAPLLRLRFSQWFRLYSRSSVEVPAFDQVTKLINPVVRTV